MKINAAFRKKLNKIAAKYSKWLAPKEFVKFYDEVAELGVIIPCWSFWDEHDAHPFEINGEEVENSRFVMSKYEADGHGNRAEYNLYFS